MTELGPAAPSPTPEELVDFLRTGIETVIEDEIETPNDPEKLYQYLNAQRNYLMYRGIQYVAPVSFGGSISMAPVAGGFGSGSDDESGPAYDYTQNIFRGYGNKFIAAVGQRSPNVMCMPDDPDNEAHINRANNAQAANRILDSWWDVDERSIEITNSLWTTGPAFIYTPYVADGVLYGFHDEPLIEIQPHPETGIPVPTHMGNQSYPNGQVQCFILDCTKVSVPFNVKNDLRYCPWLDFSEEENKGKLLFAYPELRDMNLSDGPVEGGGTAGVTGRQTRDAIISPYGGTRLNTGNWTHRRIWLQPWMYELVKDDNKRETLKQYFPRGLKITIVQGKIIRLADEKLDEVISAIQASPGATLNSDPAGQDMVSPQIITNHSLNIAAETTERGLPITFARPDVIDFQRLKEQRAKPVQFMPTLPAIGERLEDAVWESPSAKFSDEMLPWSQSVVQTAEFVVNLPPTIWGAGSAGTAREAEIQKNGALQGLGPNWMYIRKGWERAKRNGILQMCAYMGNIIRDGALSADLSEVALGGWHCEADEAIPSTWGQQQDRLLFMMEKPPAVLEAWGYNAPANIQNTQRLLGMPNWYTPGIDDYNKFRAIIAQLLQGQPQQQQQQDGSSKLMPSIPVDEFEDNHPMAVQTVQEWAQKNWRVAQSNPAGYANVIAWGRGHADLANPAPPPPPLPPATLKLSGDITKMGPEFATAIMGDYKIQTPPPPPPMQNPAMQQEAGPQQTPNPGAPGMVQ